MELYIHIPFCVKKCNYCDFLSAPATEDIIDAYINSLCREIKLTGESRKEDVSSIFIGGGTPSILSVNHINKIFKEIYHFYSIEENAEISIECNPGTLSVEKLKMYKKCGINRLSIGLQSADDKYLKFLGRIHTYDEFKDSFIMARNQGFDNINVDIISGLPKQSKVEFMDTLDKVTALNPEHISVYSLIVEEGTNLYDYVENQRAIGIEVMPEDDLDREIYHETGKLLEKNGYNKYEISNYAKAGYECKHNLGYWKGVAYLGFGIGAASYSGEKRYLNIRDIKKYISILHEQADESSLNLIYENIEHLNSNDKMSEYMILGFRLTQGIDVSDFKEKFEKDVFDIYGNEINKFINLGLMENKNHHLFLTQRGVDVSNSIMCEFIR